MSEQVEAEKVEHDDEKPDYEKRIGKIVEQHTWVCSTHGMLESENVGVSVGGQLICEICSAALIGRPNADIDPSVEMQGYESKENREYVDV